MRLKKIKYHQNSVKETLDRYKLSWDDVVIHGEKSPNKKVFLSFFDLFNSNPSKGNIIVFSTEYKLSCVDLVDDRLLFSRVLRNENALKRYRNSVTSSVMSRVRTYLFTLNSNVDHFSEEYRICKILSEGKPPKKHKSDIEEAGDLILSIDAAKFSGRDLSYISKILRGR